jgi:hypothetical protein
MFVDKDLFVCKSLSTPNIFLHDILCRLKLYGKHRELNFLDRNRKNHT